MAKVIISIPYEGGLIFLRGVNFEKHEVTINGNPTKLTRVEKFMIQDGNQVITESYFFPIEYLMILCSENDAIDENNNLISVQ
jgi:hypothetical protein